MPANARRLALLTLLWACAPLFGCDGIDTDARGAEAGPTPDAEIDGFTDAPDVGFTDLAVADARPEADAEPDSAVDGGVDTGAVDAAPDARVEPDAALEPDAEVGPDRCSRWLDVDDADLVAALHADVSETYRPIAARPDLGGNPNRYTTARRRMFVDVEWAVDPERGAGYECVYTGRFIQAAPGTEPDDDIMNCEHTWPRARMSPRDSRRYSHEQSDIHHLLPTISGANSLRGSDRFGDVVDGRNLDFLPAVWGSDENGEDVFQPRRERKGDIARVVFYFSIRWGKGIRADEEAALRSWMRTDPVEDRERDRNDRIEGIQGNRNPFVDCPELVERIPDFADFAPLDTDETLPPP